MTYQLTELQEKWLKALESGEYPQGQRVLGSAEAGGFCCLGVLCTVAGVDYEESAGYPTHKFAMRAGLRDRAGSGLDSIRIERLGDMTLGSLSSANDNGATFAEIAAAIRANPENFFLPPEAQS